MKRLLFVLTLIASALVPAVSEAQFKGMKPRILRDANTLVLINAEKLFGSPVADRERWEARRQAAYDAGISALPPDATEVVLAGRADHEFGESLWELAMIRLRSERNVTTVAQRFGGTMDEISGRSAARLPNDHYVLQLAPTLLASYTPANRQDVARWLRSTDRSTAGFGLSPYLERAFEYATKVGTPIIMAMDVEGAISPDEVKRRLASFEAFQAANVPIEKVAKLISGVHGITLGITVEDDTIGAIRVDFADSPELLSAFGKPLLIEVLRNQGAMIDDIVDWNPSISGNTFTLKGKLSTNGARRVMSVLELPPSLTDAVIDAQSPGADQEGAAKLIATQQYWKSVTSMLDDLRMKPKRDHVKTFGQAAMWYDKYARKMDRLPILNVDEEMLGYGTQMASSLRDAEMAMKGVGMRSSQRTASNNPSSGGYYSSFGGYRANTGWGGVHYGPSGVTAGVSAMNATLQEKGRTDAIIRGQERTRGAATVQDIWQGIDETTAEMRRKMVAKYSTDF